MKKIKYIALPVMIIVLAFVLSSCGNRAWFDTTYTFDKAVLSLPDGKVVSGIVTSWLDFEDGDQIQVTVNGSTYLVHSSNIALIAE